MATRRQQKIASVIQQVVSGAIMHHLNDPRIEGFISVTRVEVAADLRSADVYLSIFGERSVQNKTFAAINSASGRIQAFLADELESKFCPVLRFHQDEKFKKTLQTMQLIEQAAQEYRAKEPIDEPAEPDELEEPDEVDEPQQS